MFRVPGLGSYVGQAASGLRVLTPTSVVLHYSGPATLRPAIAPDGSLTGSVREPAAVTVDLQAQIDPAHHTAEATLRDGGRRYHLVVPAVGENGLEATLDAVEAAFVADDPLALYPYTSGDLRAAYSATAFADTWRAQSATIGRVTAMRRTALSEPQTNDLGFVFVIASYEVDRVKPDGSTATASFDVYFVREGGTWNLLFSRAR